MDYMIKLYITVRHYTAHIRALYAYALFIWIWSAAPFFERALQYPDSNDVMYLPKERLCNLTLEATLLSTNRALIYYSKRICKVASQVYLKKKTRVLLSLLFHLLSSHVLPGQSYQWNDNQIQSILQKVMSISSLNKSRNAIN